MDALRVALVADHFLPRIGGIELHVADLARRLTAAGHRVKVLTTTPPATAASGPTDSESLPGVDVQRLPVPLLPRFQIPIDPRGLHRLGRYLEQLECDVVHVHASVVSPLAYSTVFWCQQLEIPHVLTGHSVWRHASHLCRMLSWLRPAAFARTQWTSVSQYTATGLRRAGLRQVDILPNGIDVADWRIEPTPCDELRVASVMRMNVKKRPHDLVRAVPETCRLLGPQRAPKFRLIGDGPFRRHVVGLVNQLGLQDTVDLPGRMTRPQIREEFRRTKLFVLPTQREAFGIAVLEARCAGLPVVAMRGSGSAELVEHGRQGLLANGPAELAGCIAEILGNPTAQAEMARRAREGVEQFDWSVVLARHLAVYDRAMEVGRRSQRSTTSPDPRVPAPLGGAFGYAKARRGSAAEPRS